MPSRNLPTFARIEDMPLEWQGQARELLGMKPKKEKKRAPSPAPIPVSGSKVNSDGSILLVIPHPPKSCSPNLSRTHWATIHNAKKRLAGWTYDAIVEAFQLTPKPNWKAAFITYFWYHKKGQARDQTNIIGSMKAAEDAIERAGIVENDRGVTMLPPECKVDHQMPRVEILIREKK